ncbi:MAG: hypothetical protein WD894_09170 [Pirellulales bacterium]
MRWSKRVALAAVLLVLIALVVGGVWLYRSLVYVPEFYSQALAVGAPELQQSNREMLQRTAALNNDLKRIGEWQALFTDQQINGWLAVDVPKNHPDLLPPEVENPRLRITPDGVFAGAQFEGEVSAVVSVELAVRLTATNVLAVRINKARVGDVPWPLDRVVDEVVAAAASWGLQVEQTHSDGDPLLLVTLPPELNDGRRQVLLEHLELRNGEVFLSGRTSTAPTPPQ